jgi:hypothetical protein
MAALLDLLSMYGDMYLLVLILILATLSDY